MNLVDEYISNKEKLSVLKARQSELSEQLRTFGLRYLPSTSGAHCILVAVRKEFEYTQDVVSIQLATDALNERLSAMRREEVSNGKAIVVGERRYCMVRPMTPFIKEKMESGDNLLETGLIEQNEF